MLYYDQQLAAGPGALSHALGHSQLKLATVVCCVVGSVGCTSDHHQVDD